MNTEQLRELSADELLAKEEGLREEEFNLRFQHATRQLENTARLPQVKREIARVRTLLRERDLAGAGQ
ncbi:MAG: 50S ribosomal protein L29 [Deferrisomatales bacterium]|nr:50S ribosomal protein L29 [Deferrisomatales bacterium]HSH68908.1 50S ribosomal protein L29 [Deferrisomatales bacterium]